MNGDFVWLNIEGWLSETRRISVEEEGLLITCLSAIETTKAPIPLDDIKAAQLLRCGISEYIKPKLKLLRCGKLKETSEGIVLGDSIENLIRRSDPNE